MGERGGGRGERSAVDFTRSVDRVGFVSQLLTRTEGRNSAPATCPTSFTAASAGALAVRAVKAAAAATWLDTLLVVFFPADILVAIRAPLVAGALTHERGMVFAAVTFILSLLSGLGWAHGLRARSASCSGFLDSRGTISIGLALMRARGPLNTGFLHENAR